MGTIREVYERFSAAYAAIPDAVSEVVSRTPDVLLDLNRDQLLQGRDADGELLSPTYMNDPYFNTEESGRWFHNAGGYFKMKRFLENLHRQRMTYAELYGEKPTDVPNLIITGPFQNSFFIRVSRDSYTIGATYVDADDISAKYKNRVYGLAPKSREFYYFGFIRPAILLLYEK
jgi:hypothetical protein